MSMDFNVDLRLKRLALRKARETGVPHYVLSYPENVNGLVKTAFKVISANGFIPAGAATIEFIGFRFSNIPKLIKWGVLV